MSFRCHQDDLSRLQYLQRTLDGPPVYFLALDRDHPIDARENADNRVADRPRSFAIGTILRGKAMHHHKWIDEVDVVDHQDRRTFCRHVLNPLDVV